MSNSKAAASLKDDGILEAGVRQEGRAADEAVIDLCGSDDDDQEEKKQNDHELRKQKRKRSPTKASADAIDLDKKVEESSESERYRQTLGPLRFGICETFQVHTWDEKTNKNPPPNYPPMQQPHWMAGGAKKPAAAHNTAQVGNPARNRKKLYRELLEYQLNLPIHDTGSIFVRACENNLKLVRALLTGPDETPYENGCFLFDLLVDHTTYPAQPPKVHFLTTGQGRVRFNPNLYNCGKVCLSLLGTWSGPAWQPHKSTLLQVLVSIQGLILVPDPYFNEPSFSTMKGRPSAEKASAAYNKNIRRYTLEHAMNDFLKSILATAGQTNGTAPAAAAPPVAAAAAKKKSPAKSSKKKKGAAGHAEYLAYMAQKRHANTPPLSATFLHDSYPELERIVITHFCERAAAIEQQLDAWIKLDGNSIKSLAESVRSNLHDVVGLVERGELLAGDDDEDDNGGGKKPAAKKKKQRKSTGAADVIAID